LGNPDNLSENFDARVNISLSFLVEKVADAILKVTEERVLQRIGQQRKLTNIVLTNMCPPLLSSMWKITQLQKNGHKFKKFFLTGYTYRCITKHLKIKSFPTPPRYALKATFVGDSYTVSIAIIYLGDNRFLQHKNTKRHQRYCKCIYIFFSIQTSESVAQR
jgi:hypothetical protein